MSLSKPAVKRLREVLTLQRRSVRPKPDQSYRLAGVRLYGNGCRVQDDSENGSLKAPALSQIHTGNIIYNKMWASKGAFAVVAPEFDGCWVTSEYPIFSTKEGVSADYLGYFFKQPWFWARAKSWSSGTTSRARLNPRDFLLMRVPIPISEQQKTIATVLRSVDETIDKTKNLIGHIEKLRRCLLTHFFSRGLQRSHKEFKKSHIGSIPSTWAVEKMDNVAKIGNGLTPSRKRQDYWEGGNIPWMSSGKVNDVEIVAPTAYITEKAVIECSIKVLPRGTILVAMIGQGKTRGIAARLGINACINQNVAYVIPNDRIDSMFLFYYLQHQYAHLRSSGRGSNQDAINCAILKSYPVPLPSMNEQKTIAQIGESFEHRIAAERAYLAQLEAVKRGLAQALLSGQVRVKGF